jgi:hypothetical protein
MAMLGALIGGIAAFVSLRWLTKPREDVRWIDAAAPGKYITVDGVRLHYVERGPANRTDSLPIVMIHGFGGHTFSFRYQHGEFSRDHRCVAIDLKGLGFPSGRRRATTA